MKISEVFYSLQGEGKLLGVPSIFVRTSGCNLRCSWCDTPYASWQPQETIREIPELLAEIASYPARHVVLTGGEPFLQSELPQLVGAIQARGYHLTVETAGTLWQDLPMDLASISPKLSNSTPHQREEGRFARAHEAQRINLQVLEKFRTSPLIRERQWKFVLAEPTDLREMQNLLERLGGIPAQDVVLMPEGTDAGVLHQRGLWLTDLCKAHGYRFSPRLHVELFGNRRGV